MDLPGGGNPMAEIALALSMAFFSVLVLALVSMGAGIDAGKTLADGLELRPATAAAGAEAAPETLLIHWRGRLYDRDLKPVAADAVGDGPVVLAVAPDLPVEQAVGLRGRFADRDLTVTALDRRWLDRLEEIGR